MTVSRALNNQCKGKNKEAARRAERIRRIARDLGYRRSPAPQAIVTGRFNAVGILRSIDPGRGYLPHRRLVGFEQMLSQANLHLMIGQASDEQLTQADQVANILQDWMIDGLLMDYVRNIPPGLETMLEHYGVPAVWVNSKHDTNCVYVDDWQVAYNATKALIEAGHRQLGYFGPTPGPCDHYSVTDRRDGFLQAVREAGLTPLMWETPVNFPATELHVCAESFLQASNPRPTAFFAYRQAFGQVLIGLCVQRGWRIPGDMSLIVVNDDSMMYLGTCVPIMEMPEYEIGEMAASMVIRRIEDPSRSEPAQTVIAKLQMPPGGRL